MNLHHDKEAFAELIIGAANELAIPTNVIEKDYYVTITMKALAEKTAELEKAEKSLADMKAAEEKKAAAAKKKKKDEEARAARKSAKSKKTEETKPAEVGNSDEEVID